MSNERTEDAQTGLQETYDPTESVEQTFAP